VVSKGHFMIILPDVGKMLSFCVLPLLVEQRLMDTLACFALPPLSDVLQLCLMMLTCNAKKYRMRDVGHESEHHLTLSLGFAKGYGKLSSEGSVS